MSYTMHVVRIAQAQCLLIVCALFIVGCQPATQESTVNVVQPTPEKSVAPATPRSPDGAIKLIATDYQGVMKLVESHRGKVVVLDVWNSSCVPCIREFPGLVELHGRHDRKDVICLSMCLDYLGVAEEPPESFRPSVLEFLTSRGATFENVLLTEPSDDILEKLKLFAPPAVLVYGRDGKLAHRFDNEKSSGKEFTYAEVGQLVEKLAAMPSRPES